MKGNGGWGKFKYDIFEHFKNFCICHIVPPPSTTMKNLKINKTDDFNLNVAHFSCFVSKFVFYMSYKSIFA